MTSDDERSGQAQYAANDGRDWLLPVGYWLYVFLYSYTVELDDAQAGTTVGKIGMVPGSRNSQGIARGNVMPALDRFRRVGDIYHPQARGIVRPSIGVRSCLLPFFRSGDN